MFYQNINLCDIHEYFTMSILKLCVIQKYDFKTNTASVSMQTNILRNIFYFKSVFYTEIILLGTSKHSLAHAIFLCVYVVVE